MNAAQARQCSEHAPAGPWTAVASLMQPTEDTIEP